MTFLLDYVGDNIKMAPQLEGTIKFYEGGILRLLINEVVKTEQRYRVASEPDFAVMDSQLKPTKVTDYIQDINSVLLQPLDSQNTNFIIEAAPFRIKSYVNEELTMTLN